MPRKRKKVSGKRMKVDVWVGDSLRAAIGAVMRDDGKPANDVQVRSWAESQMDDASTREVEKFEAHAKSGKQRRGA